MEIKAYGNANSVADSRRLPDGCRLHPSRLVVCEQTGRWAAALRRALSSWGPSSRGKLPEECLIEETRSVEECWKRLEQSPAGFVVVELTQNNIQQLLVHMGYMEWRFSLARVAVVARSDAFDKERLSQHEWLFRQSGAVFFGTSLRSETPRGVCDLAAVACRHLQQSPRPQRTIFEEIEARLPWKGFST